MINLKSEINKTTNDKIFKYILDCGLKLFICKKKDFRSYIAMFGTEYGSIDNEFKDINTSNRVKVPEGIAHFLEHKLFEQPNGNALDLFAKIGVSANAYTSFDHTVYYFETTGKFKQSLEKLVELVTTPYFTVENVEKEKGIITQELKMYEDDPISVVYYNTLKAMYINNPLNIDIVGTQESIQRITKQDLYTCYNNFYSLNNMFFIITGDVKSEETANYLNNIFNNLKRNKEIKTVERYRLTEPKEIKKAKIENKLEIYMPYISIGFKLSPVTGSNNKKNKIIVKIIEKACFSEISDLYEKMYNEGLINDNIEIEYGYGKDYAYIILLGCSLNVEKYKQEILNAINDLKRNGIDEDIFNIAKNQIIGSQIYSSESLMSINRQIIDAVIQETEVFDELEILKQIQKEDINKFINESFNDNNRVESIITSKKGA